MAINYETLKLFYIGKQKIDGESVPLVYENKDLLTHAAIIGMTGSGKTGLGITLLEEAVIDNIPSIIIDPKGDMTNLMLAFDGMSAAEFEPWIDESEAVAAGLSISELAEKKAELWRGGIERDFQDLDRVKRYKESGDFTIYTPASDAGVKVSILSSFKAPPREILEDFELSTTLVGSMVASIFALMGDKHSDSSKESVLLNTIFMHHFSSGNDLSLEDLVREVLNPPFDRVGAFDLETFFSQNDRLKFSLKLNALIANPAFSSWIEGVGLDISNMLYSPEGRAKVNIFSIAHLNDAQRMFFVTILLNELLAWMRRQEGTTSLKALLYMDEIFGYFPPTANPPSKEPMLTLLKQARAFGVGIVLSTQNPVDIDYKGLSNIGTWFIGRLQTKQDIARVIDGLSSANGELDKAQIADMISNLEKRNFILNNVNSDSIEVFETRWALSYLKGPIPRDGIARLMSEKKSSIMPEIKSHKASSSASAKPIVAPSLEQRYIYKTQNDSPQMQPYLELSAKVRFVNVSKNIDSSRDIEMAYYLSEDMGEIIFDESEDGFGRGDKERRGAIYYGLATFVQNDRDIKKIEKDFSDYLYREQKLVLYKNDALKLHSKDDESLSDFRLRLKDRLNERIDEQIEKLKERFSKDNERLESKLMRLNERLSGAESKASASKTDALINIGTSILGAFFGSGRSASKIASGAKNANKLLRGSEQVKLLQSDIAQIEIEQDRLREKLEDELSKIKDENDIDRFIVDEIYINPRRTDIYDIKLSLVWVEC